MASDGSSSNPGRLCLLETVNHWKYMLTIMERDSCQPGDFEKIEKAVQQTFDWLDKNKHAKKEECYRRERNLMRLGERVLYRSDCGLPREPEDEPADAPPLKRPAM